MTATKIPDDVMETAREACPSHMFAPGVQYEVAHNATIQAIARAIRAERERCAKTVENWKADLVEGEIIENAIHRLAGRISRGEP